MDEDLIKYLDTQDLREYEDTLLGLGMKQLDHAQYVVERDLMDTGIPLVQATKFFRNLPGEEDEAAAYEARDSLPPLVPLERETSRLKRRHSTWWKTQGKRPNRLIFIRHGESEANVDRTITQRVPDHALHLTAKGRVQALDAGQRLLKLLRTESVKFTVSPYTRTRETLNGILQAWGAEASSIKVREDVRIREQEFGNFDCEDMTPYFKEKKKFGSFYYRFPDGESPADCYDRASTFWESVYRSWEDNEADNQVIVSHGMMILVVVMRLFKLKISEFDSFASLTNCEFVVLEREPDDPKYEFKMTWGYESEPILGGLRKKEAECDAQQIWNGDPDAPLLTSTPHSVPESRAD